MPLTCFIFQTLTVDRRSDPSVQGRVESQFHPVIPGRQIDGEKQKLESDCLENFNSGLKSHHD